MSDTIDIKVPDIGDFDKVEVIEVLVSEGDEIQKEDSVITLESDKASMEIPSPHAGVVKEVLVSVNDEVSEGTPILKLETRDETGETPDTGSGEEADADQAGGEAAEGAREEEASADREQEKDESGQEKAAPAGEQGEKSEESGTEERTPPVPSSGEEEKPQTPPHASPAVRRFARELGVDLHRVKGSGPKGRILKEDVQGHVKTALQREEPAGGAGLSLPEAPQVDFAKFGETETQALSRIQKRSGPNVHRNWLTIPHVTQFDEADITELEQFRKDQQDEAAKHNVKLTLTAFLIKASVAVLKRFPQVNASLAPDGENLIIKKYYHIGVAVDTEQGLVVPVLRDADQKGLFEIARELGELSQRARKQQLTPEAMQGGTFTISSLGGLGGTGFTPIINAPEAAILGVARASMRPVYRDGEFVPRLILPFSLSYDHRIVDGADGVRFTSELSAVLADLRRILL